MADDNVTDEMAGIASFLDDPTPATAPCEPAADAAVKPHASDDAAKAASEAGKDDGTMPVSAHVAERKAWQARHSKQASRIAELEAQSAPIDAKPEPFKGQAELDELESVAKDDDAELTGAQARKMADLKLAKADHDRAQQAKIDDARKVKAQADSQQATIRESITAFKADNPELAKAMTNANADNLSEKDWKKVGDAGDDAGKVLHDLIVQRTPELREAANDGSQNPELETGTKSGKGQGAAKRQPGVSVSGPMTAEQVAAWVVE